MAKREGSVGIEINRDNLSDLVEKLETDSLSKSDYPYLKSSIMALINLIQLLDEKNLSISRLRKLFSIKTEKSRDILKSEKEVDDKSSCVIDVDRVDKVDGDAGDQVVDAGEESNVTGEEPNPENGNEPEDTSHQKKGHGRNGVSAYMGLRRVKLSHKELKHGDRCPLCPKGTVYRVKKPLTTVLITGNAPLQGIIYERERLRCGSCQAIFKPELPKGIIKKKYDERARAIISLLKYGYGMPFNRLENLQKSVGIPMPASNQWELVKSVGNIARYIYVAMIYKAAQAELFYHDDTRVKILSLMDDKNKVMAEENVEIVDAERQLGFDVNQVQEEENDEIADEGMDMDMNADTDICQDVVAGIDEQVDQPELELGAELEAEALPGTEKMNPKRRWLPWNYLNSVKKQSDLVNQSM
jgi:hypothetical protein